MRPSARMIVMRVIGTAMFLPILTLPVAAQQAKPAKRATAREVTAVLASHPELSSGFTTPEGAKGKVVKKIPGGISIEATSARGVKGIVNVVGPPPVIAEPMDWTDIAFKLIDLAL